MKKLALVLGSITIIAAIAAVIYFFFGDYFTDFDEYDDEDFDGEDIVYTTPDN
ncbi:MAG: hypothetical protein K6G36_01100 [Candidatus Saccharibacteria bacterium]|nr:hypothetical protein [Candidatus Saccharibacteria bacterium]